MRCNMNARHGHFRCFSNWYGRFPSRIRSWHVTRSLAYAHTRKRNVGRVLNQNRKLLAFAVRACATMAEKGRPPY